jgi:hypothetical protein
MTLPCCEMNYPAKESCDDCGSEICSGCRKCVWGRRLCWACCEAREFGKDATYEEGVELSEQEEYDTWRVLTEGQNLTHYDVFSAGFKAGTQTEGTATEAGAEGRDVEAAEVTEQDRAAAVDVTARCIPQFNAHRYYPVLERGIATAIAKARAEGAAAERERLSVLMPCGHPVSDWQPDQASCGACNETADLLGKAWHAIETAPKDGSRVLVCLPRCGNLILRASYDAVHGYWKTDQDSEGITRPTFFHPGDCWMLMPTPPARPASPPTREEE